MIIGRGHNHEGIWFCDEQIPTQIRKKDRLLEFLRKHVAGCGLISSEMDTMDRAFSIHFSKWRRECKLFFFYSSRELYFQTKIWSNKTNSYEYFQSWRGKCDLDDMSFEDFNEVGRKEMSDKELVSKSLSGIKLIDQEMKAAKSKGVTPKSIKFLKRKIKNIAQDLENAQNYLKIEEDIDNIDFESLSRKTKIFDVKINFKTDEHFNRRNEAFNKVKKLKKAEQILKLRLSDTQEKLDKINQKFSKSENKLKVVEPVWKIQKKKEAQVSINEYIVKELDGLKLGVGKNSKGNDQLRSEFASKDDWWFHLSDRPSSHIVAKGIDTISPKILDLVGEEFCKIESAQEVDIVYTQIKYLKAVKGKSGLVRYKKEKYFRYKAQS